VQAFYCLSQTNKGKQEGFFQAKWKTGLIENKKVWNFLCQNKINMYINIFTIFILIDKNTAKIHNTQIHKKLSDSLFLIQNISTYVKYIFKKVINRRKQRKPA